MARKKHSIYRVRYYLRFQAATGSLGTYPQQISGGYCSPFTLEEVPIIPQPGVSGWPLLQCSSWAAGRGLCAWHNACLLGGAPLSVSAVACRNRCRALIILEEPASTMALVFSFLFWASIAYAPAECQEGLRTWSGVIESLSPWAAGHPLATQALINICSQHHPLLAFSLGVLF